MRFCMTRRRVPAGKLLVLPPTRRGTAPSVAAQQQQLQALLPPSPPTPPVLRHQPSQYQTAATVGGGAAEGRAGASRPPSVARFSRTSCPAAGARLSAGAEGAEGPAATDNMGSAIWQGRPTGGQGREKNGQSSQTPGDPWEFSTLPRPGRCRRPCFTVRVWYRETKAVNQAADRFRQSSGKRPYGKKRK